VAAQEKTVEFHMQGSTLARLDQTGLNMKSTLAVKPGTYLAHEMVRESERDELSALSRQVEIPSCQAWDRVSRPPLCTADRRSVIRDCLPRFGSFEHESTSLNRN